MFIRSLSLFVSIQVSDAYVKEVRGSNPVRSEILPLHLSIIVVFNLNFSFLDIFLSMSSFRVYNS